MATKRNSDDEKLDPANLEKVIALLEQEKPITKKEACAILNITYNTTRLGNIITKYKEKKEWEANRRASLRGKPASADEIKFIITSYLEGLSVDSICNSTYRSTQLVNSVLDTHNVPRRAKSYDYFKPQLTPDETIRERFKEGDIVYSTRYDSIAKIEGEIRNKGQWVYRIWLLSDKWHQYAYQEACELASLEHLQALGIKL